MPVRLKVPDIGVDSRPVSLGLASDGTLEVPRVRAYAPADWYNGSRPLGNWGDTRTP
jgi:hypothetical protein